METVPGSYRVFTMRVFFKIQDSCIPLVLCCDECCSPTWWERLAHLQYRQHNPVSYSENNWDESDQETILHSSIVKKILCLEFIILFYTFLYFASELCLFLSVYPVGSSPAISNQLAQSTCLLPSPPVSVPHTSTVSHFVQVCNTVKREQRRLGRRQGRCNFNLKLKALSQLVSN